MSATVALEIDTRPSEYTMSREFTGQLLDRQLHRPLFREAGPDIVPDLLSIHDQPGSKEWIFRIADDARWNGGDVVTAHDVARRMAKVVVLPHMAWTRALLSACRVHDDRTLSMTTRQKVVLLDRILANPVFSPRRPGGSSGSYRLTRVQRNRTILVPTGRTRGSVIELVTTSSRAVGRRQFREGRLDIGWGIGVPPSFWSVDDPGPFPESQPLDMHVVVAAGRGLPQTTSRQILSRCMLSEGTPLGLNPTLTRFASEPVRQSAAAAALPAPSERWPLYFTDFPPNREIATELARSLGNRLVPTVVPYEDFISGAGLSDGFSLQIHSSHFPDDVGLLVESAVVANGSVPGAEAIRELCGAMWRTEDLVERRQIAKNVERPLDVLLRRRVLGRMLTRFRSEAPLNVPRSGWFDFSLLQPRKANK
ncbi:hypothetical protein [Arthrobacter sp. MA-N2]|uniref:hypothetical protein n=1 Tax=Arthrobacter sp. MA-N2 TaxID=1101188 RepID=UPI00048754AE|nr:hypothetical protein [Arthrobacter sp. MA-N2]